MGNALRFMSATVWLLGGCGVTADNAQDGTQRSVEQIKEALDRANDGLEMADEAPAFG